MRVMESLGTASTSNRRVAPVGQAATWPKGPTWRKVLGGSLSDACFNPPDTASFDNYKFICEVAVFAVVQEW